MKCSNCGANISDTANFCTRCGTKIEKVEKKIEQSVCHNCGETLRKGASFCVKCGTPIQKQSEKSVQNPYIQSDALKNNASTGNRQEAKQSNTSQEFYLIYEQLRKNKVLKNVIRILATIAILYVCLCLVGYAVFKVFLGESENEAASLVEAKSNISPDLKLFDLQGDVKECWQSNGLGILDELTLVFDKEGKLMDIRNRRPNRDDIEGDGVHYGLARDNEGRIVQFHQLGRLDLGDEINIHYSEDGAISKINGNYLVSPFEITYSYVDRKLINSVFETYFEDGDHLKITYTFTFENVDEYGNWLTCKRYSKTSSYNSITGEIYEETQDEMIITRKIIYYSQNLNNRNDKESERIASSIDSLSLNQCLENEMSQPFKWLYGKWEGHLSTVETTYLELFSDGTVSEKIISRDGDVFDKKGNYELQNDTISIIFNNTEDRNRIYLLDVKKNKIKFGHIFGGDIYLEKIE